MTQQASNVEETTNTTGTGTYTTSGVAADGCLAFDDWYGTDNIIPLMITDGTTWECGLYTYSASNTFDRTYILNTSNANRLPIDWDSGTRRIFVAALGELADFMGMRHNLAAVADPTTAADDEHGYDFGSIWVNTASNPKKMFVCVSPLPAAAVWLQVLGSGGLFIKEGANQTGGLAVLVAGSVVVATTKVTANSRIQLTSNVDGGAPGWLRVSARTAGTSFTITSSSGTDTSSVAWVIVEPAA